MTSLKEALEEHIMADATDWVEQVIGKLQSSASGAMDIQLGDSTVGATLAPEFVQFFQANEALLIKMGFDLFTEFVSLISQKRDEDAFDLLASQMDADDIIAKVNMNADQLQQHNNERDQFITQLKAFAISLGTSAASKLILAALGL